MTQHLRLILLTALMTASRPTSAPAQQSPPVPPVAEKRPHVTRLHGVERRDDYHWMRNRDDPALMPYLVAENAYTEAMTAHTASLQETIYNEILSRIKETDEQVPVKEGPWYYYSRTVEGQAYPIYARKRTLDAEEQIILDQNEEARPHKFYQLGGMEVSPDGNYLAILVDTSGYEDFTLRVRDLRTMTWLPDVAEKLSWGLAWASDNRTLFYVSGDSAKRPEKVWRHVLGAARGTDTPVFHEENVLFNVSIERSRSGAFVFIQTGSFTQDEWRVLDAARPEAAPVLIAARTEGVEYLVDHGGDWFYILTNRDGATDFKVMRARVETPSRWEEYLAHRPGVFVENIEVFRD